MVKEASLILMNSNKKEKLITELTKLYGSDLSFMNDMFFYINSRDKVYVASFDITKLKLERVIGIGLYLGTFHESGDFRPSIEGAQLIKPKKNVVKLNEKSFISYISGENLFYEEVKEVDVDDSCSFPIVEYNGDFVGAVSLRDKDILNYLSKGRRLDYNKVF